jgi:protein arginine N-methyltransferase 1
MAAAAKGMTNSSRTSGDALVPAVITTALRTVARWLRWLKRTLLSHPAVRDISDEVFHADFTPAEQFAHERLVADAVRMNAYRAGIDRHIKPGDVVVDLGTGTGILAMLAAQRGPKIVHAIDHSNIIAIAERVASANRFSNISFHSISSRRFVANEPVDVILHEQIGQALLDEGMIEKTLDLKKRLLKKSGRILPGKFELYLEPASVRSDHRVPYLWETNVAGIDFSGIKASPANDRFTLSDRSWEVGARSAIDYFLCAPSPILAFDLNDIGEPTDVPGTVSASRLVRRAGRLDGFCLYFRVIFDPGVEFDTSPFSPRTDWNNLLFRMESREYREGDTLTYSLAMTDRFDFETWVVKITGD